MGNAGKVAGAIAVGVVLYGGWRLINISKAGDVIETELVNPRIHKIEANPLNGGIIFRTGVRITNPTNEKIKVTQPTVHLTTNGERLATSTMSSDVTTILPKAVVSLAKDIEIKLTWGSITPYIKDIVKFIANVFAKYKSNDAQGVRDQFKATPLEMVYETRINDSFDYTAQPTKLL